MRYFKYADTYKLSYTIEDILIYRNNIANRLDEILNSQSEVKDDRPKTIVVTNERGKVVEKKNELPKTIVFKKVNLFGEDID